LRLFLVSITLVSLVAFLSACGGEAAQQAAAPVPAGPSLPAPYKQAKYASVTLAPDLAVLSDGEREALPLLVAALESIDRAFWHQVFGPKAGFLESIPDDDARRFAEINYGPWDRLDDDRPFFAIQPKPAASRFYPMDLQPGELEAAGAASADGGAALRNPYTVVRREENRALKTIPFHEAYPVALQDASSLLARAAKVVGTPALSSYLGLMAEGLKNDSFAASDEAWMKIDGALGVVLGPLDPSEDHIHRLKRAYAGAIWVGRSEWDARVGQYRSLMPELVEGLSGRKPAAGSRQVAFEVVDLIRIAGCWNAGPKRFVLELPANETLRKQSGTSRLLFHNVAQAKYDSTLVPLAENLIVAGQRDNVTFDAFFTNDLLLEMIRAEGASVEEKAMERLYGKAAWIVGMVRANAIAAHVAGQLADRGEIGSSPEQHFTTLVVSAFRSLRFGSASAQGPAALILLNKLLRDGAIVREGDSPVYRVDVEATQRSVHDLAQKLVVADDADKSAELITLLGELTQSNPELVEDLGRLAAARVPIDIAFESPGS
jgi:hypothetical protein